MCSQRAAAETEIVSEEKNKNGFDEQTLARVLEAAYVLQEHQDELEELKSSLDLKRQSSKAESAPASLTLSPSASPTAALPDSLATSPIAAQTITPVAPPPSPVSSPVPRAAATDYSSVLGQVMEARSQVEIRKLGVDDAMALVAEQVIDICGAAGAAIAIVNRNTVRYRAVAGIRTLPLGSEVSLDEALCCPCLQSGQVWRCADTNSENLMQREECRRRGIGCLIAAPLFHDGKSVGALELLFSDAGVFTEQDVHACQLMAGILTEALSRDQESRWKDAAVVSSLPAPETASAEETAADKSAPEAAASYSCYRCGHALLADEQFCGECGKPRSGDYGPAGLQSKVASLWQMQEARKTEPSANLQLDEHSSELVDQDALPAQLKTAILNPLDRSKRKSVPHFGVHEAEASDGAESLEGSSSPIPFSPIHSSGANQPGEVSASVSPSNKALEDLISPPSPAPADWSSALSARDFLEQVADENQRNVLVRFWNTRRGDIYLAIAVILVAFVIRWGMWSSHPVSAKPSPAPAPAAQHNKMTQPDVPLLERMLISLGLAEAPDPPIDKGNPSTQVWVDLHTALYYCPGTDLYGKTATGKYTTQREAQLDQFQPAYRKTCN
jgi:GAF domain-containing protein